MTELRKDSNSAYLHVGNMELQIKVNKTWSQTDGLPCSQIKFVVALFLLSQQDANTALFEQEQEVFRDPLGNLSTDVHALPGAEEQGGKSRSL